MKTTPTELWLPPPFKEKLFEPVYDLFAVQLKNELLRLGIEDECIQVAFENIESEHTSLSIGESEGEDDDGLSLGAVSEVDIQVQCSDDEFDRCGQREVGYSDSVDTIAVARAINALDKLDRHMIAVELANVFVDDWESVCNDIRDPVAYEDLGFDEADIEDLAQQREEQFLRDLPLLFERIRNGTLPA